MRRLLIILACLFCASLAWAGQGKVCKVLPQFLDNRGRQSLSSSLYERDAYQYYLRRHPKLRTALCLVVQWKAKSVDWNVLTVRAELRGLVGDTVQTITLEEPVKKTGHFSNWANLTLDGPRFQKFGELIAWRVTLLEAGKPLAQQNSFLWSGATTAATSP